MAGETKEYLAFFEEYFDYMDDLNPEQYYQLMQLIRDARFKGIYTEVKDVEDKEVRLAWRCIRPAIIKSRQNARAYIKKKIHSNDEFDKETGEIITSTKTQNKALEEPIKDKDEEVIIPEVKVAETAQKQARNINEDIHSLNPKAQYIYHRYFDQLYSAYSEARKTGNIEAASTVWESILTPFECADKDNETRWELMKYCSLIFNKQEKETA